LEKPPFQFEWRPNFGTRDHVISVTVEDPARNIANLGELTLHVEDPAIQIFRPVRFVHGTLAGDHAVSALLTPDLAPDVESVQFYLDGNLIGSHSGPISTIVTMPGTWDSTTVSNGYHHMTAVALLSNQTEIHSPMAQTNVFNVGATPPGITLTSPEFANTETGDITLSADVVGVVPDRVEFFVNRNMVGVVTEPPYAVTWDSSTAYEGHRHVGYAFMYYGNDQSMRTEYIPFLVSNPAR